MTSPTLELKNFIEDDNKNNLILYELELNKVDNPNDDLRLRAKSQGDCACRLWLLLFLANIAIITILIFLIILLLMELGSSRALQTFGRQCVTVNCDASKGLVCTANGNSKTCQCPAKDWFWYNQIKCRECPPNWTLMKGGTNCYFISQIELNFTDAHYWCQARNARLLEISDTDVFFLLQSVRDLNFQVNKYYWIGLRETAPRRNVYQWIVSGTFLSNTNYFCTGEPSHRYNYYFQQYDQCIGLNIRSNTSTCLRDSTCPNVAPFICELY